MKRRTFLAAVLNTILAVAFIVAGGSFSHTLASPPHEHTHEAAVDGSHVHDHAEANTDRLVAENETVHCGANLLALTPDDRLIVPDFLDDPLGTSPATAISRVAKIETPPPRPTFLSL
ncbi:hypothetical protein [Roseibium sp. M-1]